MYDVIIRLYEYKVKKLYIRVTISFTDSIPIVIQYQSHTYGYADLTNPCYHGKQN